MEIAIIFEPRVVAISARNTINVHWPSTWTNLRSLFRFVFLSKHQDNPSLWTQPDSLMSLSLYEVAVQEMRRQSFHHKRTTHSQPSASVCCQEVLMELRTCMCNKYSKYGWPEFFLTSWKNIDCHDIFLCISSSTVLSTHPCWHSILFERFFEYSRWTWYWQKLPSALKQNGSKYDWL